jgi:hypothetical protein
MTETDGFLLEENMTYTFTHDGFKLSAANPRLLRHAFPRNLERRVDCGLARTCRLSRTFPTFFGDSRMTLNSDSKYPSRRAYVLKLRSDAQAGALAGRLENVITGRQHEFSSGRELLESLAGDLEGSIDHSTNK